MTTPAPRDARIAVLTEVQFRERLTYDWYIGAVADVNRLEARIAVLEAALRALENALDAEAAGTSHEVYLAMIDAGMSPLLLAIDEARREARRALGDDHG